MCYHHWHMYQIVYSSLVSGSDVARLGPGKVLATQRAGAVVLGPEFYALDMEHVRAGKDMHTMNDHHLLQADGTLLLQDGNKRLVRTTAADPGDCVGECEQLKALTSEHVATYLLLFFVQKMEVVYQLLT